MISFQGNNEVKKKMAEVVADKNIVCLKCGGVCDKFKKGICCECREISLDFYCDTCFLRFMSVF